MIKLESRAFIWHGLWERGEGERESTLFNCSVIRAPLRLIPGYGLHKEFFFTEPGKRSRRRRRSSSCRSLGNEERERERVLVSRFVPVVRFFAFSDQTAKPRLIRPVFLFLPFDCLSSLPSFYIIFELIGFPFPVVAPDLGQPARLNRSEKWANSRRGGFNADYFYREILPLPSKENIIQGDLEFEFGGIVQEILTFKIYALD